MLFWERGRALILVTTPFLGVRGNVFRRQAIFFGGRTIYAAITDEGRTEDSGETKEGATARTSGVGFSVGGSPHRDLGTSLGQSKPRKDHTQFSLKSKKLRKIPSRFR